ncbi:MAG TPA: TonB-dependent receptor [Gemmatimonadaceae bacterium]
MIAFFRRAGSCLLVALCCALPAPLRAATVDAAASSAAGDIRGTVSDSASGQPLVSAEIAVTQVGRPVTNTTTDEFGRYTVHAVPAGTYQLTVHYIGFRPQTRTVVVGQSGDAPRTDFHMVGAPVSLSAVEVRAEVPLAVNTRTGDQTFKQNDYHGAPTNTTSQILQQSIAGAARAPTGEVHIRGQHAEYTYYVDGVPVPAGISGSLNELFDPQVVNTIDFQTGGWDAEYGNKNAAIVNVQTKIPTGAFHADASAYTGSFNSKGTSVNASTNAGPLGLFGSFAYQTTDMRREPLSFDTTTFVPRNFHNHGEDLFTFGKVTYTISPRSLLNLDVNWSRTTFQVPFDSSGGAFADDHQRDVNSFANLSWRRMFGGSDVVSEADAPSELFLGAFVRGGSLDFTPGAGDIPAFVFFPDTTTAYNLSESRHFTTYGAKVDYLIRPARELEFKTGVLASSTTGHETFSSIDANGVAGPGSNSGLNGSDVGLYAQTAWAPVEQFELRTGVRYDAHTAPFAGTKTQLSPRIRLNFFPSPATTLYAYYGRLFIPTNIEELRDITNAATGTVAEPTVPERDDFFEGGIVHRFPFGGVVTKLSGYHKVSSPGIDDATIPGSAIVTSVNIQRIVTNGIEGVIEVRPGGPLSGYLNASLIHAYGNGLVSGGFLPIAPPQGNFDLDHDQRLSMVGNATYSVNRLFVSATAIYGSGLTNGLLPTDLPDASYGTGLLDFNRDFKVKPSTIFNASAGYSIVTGSTVVRPQIYVDNLFDKHYLLKGSFFSGAQVGRPRSIQFRLNVGV